MKRAATMAIATCAILTTLAPASADEPATIITSTETNLVMRDDRGDQEEVEGSTTRPQREAADVRRVRVWQEDGLGYIAVSLRGSIRARSVRRWFGTIYLLGRDDASDPTIKVAIQPARSRTTTFRPDGSQTTCRPRSAQVSNLARTITFRIPTRCRWSELGRVMTTVIVQGRGEGAVASDFAWARSRLSWQ